MSSAICFNLNQSKILSGNGLTATFQLSSAASLNLGWSENSVLGTGLKLRFSVMTEILQNFRHRQI